MLLVDVLFNPFLGVTQKNFSLSLWMLFADRKLIPVLALHQHNTILSSSFTMNYCHFHSIVLIVAALGLRNSSEWILYVTRFFAEIFPFFHIVRSQSIDSLFNAKVFNDHWMISIFFDIKSSESELRCISMRYQSESEMFHTQSFPSYY